MAWNEPGNNGGQDKDPWGNRGGRDQGPPDLDEVFGKLSRKLSGLFGGKGPSFGGGSVAGLGVIAVVGAVIWGVSGFYTIGEAERGVVLRFGEYDRIVQPGLNWKPTFIDEVTPVNVQAIRSLRGSGDMLTKDENVVRVEMDVQYRVADPEKYLFSVTNADDSLRQATDSALRAVIGDAVMDQILTSGRQEIRERTEVEINRIVDRYDMGLLVVDVNFDTARPPEQVKDAFDDAIAAREDEERFIREAEAYRNDILPKATGRAERLKKEALGYKEKTVNEAQGDVAQFEKLLPEYLAAPEVTRNRLYLETMEKVFGNTSKVLIDSQEGSNNLLYLPLDKLMSQSPAQRNVSSDSNSAAGYGIELERATQPALPNVNTRQSTTRQGRY
ncbi:FtsH protease activity modulator HflK [Grimontia hollisae]|uniref:Protein HflK n=2 Tax=Grimontia hollisae TaxID=673 RepID=D0I8R1_GRIHO|nr:FtsH protease activity modulator HflK [Grimontia hollisae]AMG30869.1 FtsH protease activity modulator HflK [Grimontia hollisae]EEY73030.1 HflK protein [Grimontia hollisae CIP 101886]MDF2183191.1 FtsH protease activity modulator HflK [Grimontia hollisae]STO47226.1 Modulator of FtsH protease HflK [Grimontia hollisae]STO56041.1 Modulator of FtsH protease HflK [Grimontia hollisae]